MRQDWAYGTDRLLAKYDYFSRRLSPTVRRVSHTDLLSFMAGTES
jgi:hypothetical protein